MCICVNCNHVHTCTTYALIKKQHKKTNINDMINFVPSNTIIQVNIKSSKNNVDFDWDLQECLSFVEKPGYWLTSVISKPKNV